MVAGDVPARTAAAVGDSIGATQADELHERYLAYRRRQAARLVQMLPRDAVRPLYRRAREEAKRCGALNGGSEDDPLALLVDYCQGLLPLPTFDLWLHDLHRYPDGHLADLAESNDAPTAEAPSTMEVRIVEYLGRPWLARLRSFRDEDLWRGYIAFEERDSGRVHRTAAVFCEDHPSDLRDRFLSFESTALEAFLRSALP
jgi:hypothetical protein